MRSNADFTRPAIVTPDQFQWVPSPQGGVERVMLDRVGAEKARATSIVRYAANSHFPEHGHPGGEEILVLSGTFSERFSDGLAECTQHYPAGWYLRSPRGSAHQPFSADGCTSFVKLWQFPASEDCRIRIDTNDPARWVIRDGRHICPLFGSEQEAVSLERLAPGEPLFPSSTGSAEILVLTGELEAPPNWPPWHSRKVAGYACRRRRRVRTFAPARAAPRSISRPGTGERYLSIEGCLPH